MRSPPAVPYFVVRLVLVIGAIHGCYCAAMTGFVERRYSNRMANVRALEPAEWQPRQRIVAAYLEAAARDVRPRIGLFGSSFSWGYPYSQDDTLSRPLVEARPDRRVVNVSVIGFGLDGIHQLTTMAEYQNCRFETLLVEIPIVNELAYLATQAEPACWERHYASTRDDFAFVQGTSHFGWMLRRPSSFDLSNVAAEEASLVDSLMPNRFAQPAAGYFASRETFERLRSTYRRKLIATLESTRRIADRVVAYPSLVCLSAGDRIRYDAAAIGEQIDATVDACRRVPDVVVLRPTDRLLTEESLYLNLTHLNVQGNAEFGRWLVAELRKAERGGDTAHRP
jgi:hypothetical protein